MPSSISSAGVPSQGDSPGDDVQTAATRPAAAPRQPAGMPDARGAALWGELGRKVDPTGVRRDGTPILAVETVRNLINP